MITRARMGWRDQRGVAMVTVLLVGAALTAVASVAAFTTIREFEAAKDDRKAAEALAYSEAGIDRLVLELRRGNYTWGDIREAGCQRPALSLPDGVIGSGTYDVELVAFNPTAATPAERFPIPPTGGACSAVADTSPRSTPPHYFAITSTGTRPAARRVVRFVVEIKALNLPIGVYAETADAQGNPQMTNISMIVKGDVTGRNFLGFFGSDPYYKVKDFWTAGFTQAELDMAKPAGIHATGHIFLKNSGGTEHTVVTPMNCTANKPGGPGGQSMWDQSSDGGPISGPKCATWVGQPTGPPPTSLFTQQNLDAVTPKPTLSDQDYLTLRDSAKQSGIYCFVPTPPGQTRCSYGGGSEIPGDTTITPEEIAQPSPIPQTNFVTYIEFENGATAQSINLVRWEAPVTGCQDGVTPGRTVTLIVRKGSLRLESGIFVNGAFIVPEGTVTLQGDVTLNGTVIAKKFDTNGGPRIQLNDCWVKNMPGPFLDVNPFQWSEIDR